MYQHRFTVEGMFRFPLDMLRYDACYPFRQADVASLLSSLTGDKGPHKIQLLHVADKRWRPTTQRWKSFVWSVVDHEAYPY